MLCLLFLGNVLLKLIEMHFTHFPFDFCLVHNSNEYMSPTLQSMYLNRSYRNATHQHNAQIQIRQIENSHLFLMHKIHFLSNRDRYYTICVWPCVDCMPGTVRVHGRVHNMVHWLFYVNRMNVNAMQQQHNTRTHIIVDTVWLWVLL